MCCRCAVVVVIAYHLCTVDVWFASGADVYLQHIYPQKETTYRTSVLLMLSLLLGQGQMCCRCAVDVL